jgi:Uma2 family endonuclease
MATARRLHYAYDEYLELLERSDIKLEYCDGVIYAMAGGTIAHGALGAAVIRLLGNGLPAGCTVYSSDTKVRIEATDLSTFPDASVVCGSTSVSEKDQNAVTNPTVLVEVTSRSTEDYDRGEKLRNYQQLDSLQAVLLVSHRAREVTVVRRDGKGWGEEVFRKNESIVLTAPQCCVSVDELYAGVDI